MKKGFLILFLVACYTFAISGVAVKIHYCGGEVSSVTFAAAAKKSCGCKEKSEKESCCKDEIKQFKNDPAKSEISTFKITKAPKLFITYINETLATSIQNAKSSNFSYLNKDIHYSNTPIYIRCCVFLI